MLLPKRSPVTSGHGIAQIRFQNRIKKQGRSVNKGELDPRNVLNFIQSRQKWSLVRIS
jgi:hypothetical protein